MTKLEYYNMLVVACEKGVLPSAEGKTCRYRLTKRRQSKVRCVVGLLIPDDKYDKKMEGKVVDFLPDGSYVMPDGMTENQLKDLQAFHDDVATSQEFNKESFLAKAHSIIFRSEV